MSLLLLRNKNISKRNKIEITTVSIISSILVAIIWFVFSEQYIDTRKYIIEANVKPMEQIKYILQNPFGYIKVLLNTLKLYGGGYLLGFVGSELGIANIEIPQICSIGLLFAIFILPFFERNEKSFDKAQKWIINGIAVILILLVVTGLYLTFSPVQYEIVAGVQGRYFIPIFILILLTMVNSNKNIEVKNLEIKYNVLFLIFNIISLITIYNHFMQF